MYPSAKSQMVVVARQVAPLQSTSIQQHQLVIHAHQTQFVTLQQALMVSVKLVNILTKLQLRAFVNHARANITAKTVLTDKVLAAHNSPRLGILQLSIVHQATSAPPQLRQHVLQANTL